MDNQNNNSEFEAMVEVLGTKTVTFLVYAIILLVVCAALWFLFQAIWVAIIIFVATLSLFGINL